MYEINNVGSISQHIIKGLSKHIWIMYLYSKNLSGFQKYDGSLNVEYNCSVVSQLRDKIAPIINVMSKKMNSS